MIQTEIRENPEAFVHIFQESLHKISDKNIYLGNIKNSHRDNKWAAYKLIKTFKNNKSFN